jgi:CheY-like chemotaxis protein
MARILVLEDDPLSRRFLKDVLQKALRHTVVECSTLREALSLLRANRFDALFLDQTLPDGNVTDLCQTLEQIGCHRDVPKWIVTGERPLPGDEEIWRRLGIEGHLVKPVGMDQIAEALDQCLKAA